MVTIARPMKLKQLVELPPHYAYVVAILQVFFPQYFDPENPAYVDPDIMIQLVTLAEEARPWCLSQERQNFAQAMFTAHLVSVRNETASGKSFIPVSGAIVSEKEGDIAVTYANSASGSNVSISQRPASDPWDAWNKLWQRCARGAITTRFGDPARYHAQTISDGLTNRGKSIWDLAVGQDESVWDRDEFGDESLWDTQGEEH